MKKFTLFICLLFTFAFLSAQETPPNYARVKIYASTQEDINALLQKGVCLENLEIRKGVFIIGEFSDLEMEKIRDTQIPFEILIENMSEYYVKQNAGYSMERLNEEMRKKSKTFKGNRTPANFRLGYTMGGYLTLYEILTELDKMRTLFPHLISEKIALPEQTVEERNIYWVRISNNPDIDQEKPRVLYTALTHAREVAGMQQMIYQMWDLLEKYGEDPEITYYIDNLELYFMPCVNPDGYEFNRRIEPYGGGMWRKNRKANGDGSHGIDLNRNWDYTWGYNDMGSSPDPNSEIYRGTAPFSEAETQALKGFCESRKIVLCLNNHTCGNYLIYPFGHINAVPPEHPIYKAYAERLTSENNYVYGTCYEVLGYFSNGDSDDWMYGGLDEIIFAFTPEAGNASEGFWPAASRIEEICAGHVVMNKYLMRFALPYAEIEDKSETFFQSLNNTFKFELFSLGQAQNANFSVTITPVSDNIQSVETTPLRFENVNLLDKRNGELSLILKSDIASGDEVVFDICVNNGAFTHKYRFTKMFGVLEKLIDDDCSTMNNWVSSTWNTTDSKYVSSPRAIADSPNGNYESNANTIIYSKNSYNLTNAFVAFVEFEAQWEIEAERDYVQFVVSEDNGITWIPQQGKYTKLGGRFQDRNKPLYDGNQYSWVRESIDLKDYIGKNIRVGFRLISDEHVNKDGFYFDDFTLNVIRSASDTPNPLGFTASYNATTRTITISKVENPGSFSLFSLDGKLLNSFDIHGKSHELNVSNLQTGVYFLRANSGKKALKIVVY